jgi:Fe2+ transport system protein B
LHPNAAHALLLAYPAPMLNLLRGWDKRRSSFSSIGSELLLASLLTGVVCLPLTGCGKAEQEKKIAQIQQTANERIAKAEKEAQEKIAELQKQIEAIKAEAADASAEVRAQADAAINKAQLSADEAAKAVQSALSRAREAYKEDARHQLAAINKEFTELAAQARKTPAKDKAAYDKAIKDIVARQKDVNADIAAFDKATLETFKTVKAKLVKDLALMKAAIKSALAKLPKH